MGIIISKTHDNAGNIVAAMRTKRDEKEDEDEKENENEDEKDEKEDDTEEAVQKELDEVEGESVRSHSKPSSDRCYQTVPQS